jgi:hypothetical protein
VTKINKKSNRRNNIFKKKLIDAVQNPFFIPASYTSYQNIDALVTPGLLTRIIGFKNDQISDRERNVLSLIENKEHSDICNNYSDFKWQVLAFLSVQDIFDAPLVKGHDFLSLFRQWYFYYESKYVLTEAILCGLNGFFASMGSLLRLFIEFSLLQNFFYRNIDNTLSYEVLEQYYTKGVNPNWNTIINGALPADIFTKPIKKRVQLQLKSISETCIHPYQPVFSIRKTGSNQPGPTLERIFFYTWILMTLTPVLWLYYTNFPMLFHGVDIEAKFGFNIPVGIFVEEQTTKIINKALGNDYDTFYQYSNTHQKVKDLLDWYNGRNTLSDSQIMKTWNLEQDGPISNVKEGHGKQIAKMRALREAMIFQTTEESNKDTLSNNPNQVFDLLGSFQWWSQRYKQLDDFGKKSK